MTSEKVKKKKKVKNNTIIAMAANCWCGLAFAAHSVASVTESQAVFACYIKE